MKSILFLYVVLLMCCSCTSPKQVWEKKGPTFEEIREPESVYYDRSTQSYYVSNIVGEGTRNDGQGWISKISADGSTFTAKWVEGLNAPKGIRVHAGHLWVSDYQNLVQIDLSSAKVLKRYTVDDGAKKPLFLNDVAISESGEVYVSDTQGSRIYRLENGVLKIFMQGAELESPNGLLIEGEKLYVAAWGKNIRPDWSTSEPGRLYVIDLNTKSFDFITQKPLGHLDGLERDNDGHFLVSDWMAGKVYRIDPKGKSELLLEGFKGSADIAFNSEQNVLVVPRMLENILTAYKL